MADKLGMTEIKGESWRPWQVGNVPAGCKCIGFRLPLCKPEQGAGQT